MKNLYQTQNKYSSIFLVILLSLSSFIGCGQEVTKEDLGGKAYVVSTYPVTGSEIESGSTLTFTFDDGDQIEGKQVTVNGVPTAVVGNQISWKVDGLIKGEKNNLMILWNNTDGSSGNQLLVFHVKAKPTAVEDSVENYLDLYEELVEFVESGGSFTPSDKLNAMALGFTDSNPDCNAKQNDLYEKLQAKLQKGQLDADAYVEETQKVNRSWWICVGFNDLQYERLTELGNRWIAEHQRRQ